MRAICRLCPVALLVLLGGCSQQTATGSVTFTVTVPSDPVLNPLADTRVTSLEVRDTQDALVGQTAFVAGQSPLSLGTLPVGPAKDLRLLALGPGGQQVLGLGVARDVAVTFGKTASANFNLRLPLFFFGASSAFVTNSPVALDPTDQPLLNSLLPNGQLSPDLTDGTPLRMVAPNSTTPLISGYAQDLTPSAQSPASPVMTSVGTADGLSVLAATLDGTLHIVDTGTFPKDTPVLVPLSAQPAAGAMVLDSQDKTAVILHFDRFGVVSPTGPLISVVRNLAALRATPTTAPDILKINVSLPSAPPGPPIAAAFRPDGLLDVVFGTYPVSPNQPVSPTQSYCATLSGASQSLLRTYNVQTGAPQGSDQMLAYTTGILYDSAGRQVLTQPCVTAAGASRPGQVVLTPMGGTSTTLEAPGTVAVTAVGEPPVLVAVGRDDVADDAAGDVPAQGTMRVLDPASHSTTRWTTESAFALQELQVPSPIPSGPTNTDPDPLDVLLKPRDLLIYQISATPDRARALVAARVSYHASTQGVPLGMYAGANGTSESCNMQWNGYSYHLFLVNLQTGAREQDWIVGIQNVNCQVAPNPADICNSYCDMGLDNPPPGIVRDPPGWSLSGFAQGFIPSNISVLFGGF